MLREKKDRKMQIKEFISIYRTTQKELAKRCRVIPHTISAVSLRKYRPSPKTAARIEYVTCGKVTAKEMLFPEHHPCSYIDDRYNGSEKWEEPVLYTLTEEDKKNLNPYNLKEVL